jgi:hypothetical protein
MIIFKSLVLMLHRAIKHFSGVDYFGGGDHCSDNCGGVNDGKVKGNGVAVASKGGGGGLGKVGGN